MTFTICLDCLLPFAFLGCLLAGAAYVMLCWLNEYQDERERVQAEQAGYGSAGVPGYAGVAGATTLVLPPAAPRALDSLKRAEADTAIVLVFESTSLWDDEALGEDAPLGLE